MMLGEPDRAEAQCFSVRRLLHDFVQGIGPIATIDGSQRWQNEYSVAHSVLIR